MLGIGMWLRHARWWALVLVGAQGMAMFTAAVADGAPFPAWSVDWSWMLSVWSGSTLLMSPVAGAVTAYLIARGLTTDARQVTAPLRRHWHPALDIACAVWVVGFGVQLLMLGLGSLACWLNGAEASGLTLPWQLFTGPAALLASIATTAAVAIAFPSPWTVPGVAIGIFLAHRIYFWKGFPELFTIEQAMGPVWGARPIAGHLIATTRMNLLVAAAAAAAIVCLSASPGNRPRWMPFVSFACVAGAWLIWLPFYLGNVIDTYELLP